MHKRKKSLKDIKWIQLFVYRNCFNDKENIHLGFKFKKKFYIVTHTNSKNAIEIDDKSFHAKNKDDRKSYLIQSTSKPELVNSTNMRLLRKFFNNNFLSINEKGET